jgi:anti-sigma regulatory factor (Ser/Thr protein kinase)
MTTPSDDPAVLFLRMEPRWVVVDEVRHFVESFCAAACPGSAREEQVALAAHELVQNAIMNASSSEIEVRLELDRHSQRVRVSVTNVCHPDQIPVLRDRLARALECDDPLAGYVAAMREAPERRGGLGLSRIRYESALDLGLEVSGARVTIHAAGSLAA